MCSVGRDQLLCCLLFPWGISTYVLWLKQNLNMPTCYTRYTTHATCDLCPSNHYTDNEVYNWFKLCSMGIIEARLLVWLPITKNICFAGQMLWMHVTRKCVFSLVKRYSFVYYWLNTCNATLVLHAGVEISVIPASNQHCIGNFWLDWNNFY